MKNIRCVKAHFDDKSLVVELLKRNELISSDTVVDWAWLWLKNPAYTKNWPIGWKLELDGKIVGFIGNIPLRYSLGEKLVSAAAAHCFVVDQEARGFSIKLAAQFFSQDQVELFLCTTANVSAEAVYKLFKSDSLPCSSYSRFLFWVINSNGLIRSHLSKRYKMPNIFAGFFSRFAAPLLSFWLFLQGHGKIDESDFWGGKIEIISVKDIGDEFNQLWETRKNRELPNTLLADRSAEALKWHFGKSQEVANKTRVLIARQKGVLCGYIILVRQDLPKIKLKRYQIADIFVLKDEAVIIKTLLRKTYDIAKADQVDIVNMIGFPDHVRQCFLSTFPLERELSNMPFWFLAKDRDMMASLKNIDVWYAGPYDGDTTL
jgi:hypothetical protein